MLPRFSGFNEMRFIIKHDGTLRHIKYCSHAFYLPKKKSISIFEEVNGSRLHYTG